MDSLKWLSVGLGGEAEIFGPLNAVSAAPNLSVFGLFWGATIFQIRFTTLDATLDIGF